MGQFYDKFHRIKYANEAEVSKNFIIPLLQDYLGYMPHEILPEKHFPAKDLYSGVSFKRKGTKELTHRPDFVVCLNGDANCAKFIIDSKSPDEDLERHIGQLKSYSNSVSQNFLLITNGTELKVFDANELIFHARDVEELQIKLHHLSSLLSRERQQSLSPIQILKEFDHDSAIGIVGQITDAALNQKKLVLIDFLKYLEAIKIKFSNWPLPNSNFRGLDNLDIRKLNPRFLHSFYTITNVDNETDKRNEIKLSQIEADPNTNIKVLVGNTGLGKSSLLRFLAQDLASHCLQYIEIVIPIYIALRSVSRNKTLSSLIEDELRYNGFEFSSLSKVLSKNKFLLLLDAYDEIPEEAVRDFSSELTQLSKTTQCILSTRPNRIPRFPNSSTFQMALLDKKKIEYISRKYFGDGYYRFRDAVDSNSLSEESQNTLLLLLMISVFKENETLPGTSAQIADLIVERLREWDESKYEYLLTSDSRWIVTTTLLSRLAFHIVQKNDFNLSIGEATPILLDGIYEFEQKRLIPLGTTTDSMFELLFETGYILKNDVQIFFWHRVFLNYFSSIFLAERLHSDFAFLNQIKNLAFWESTIIGSSIHFKDSSNIIESLKENIWLASYCLITNPNCKEKTKNQIIELLIEKCDSVVRSTRERALFYLKRIQSDKISEFFQICMANGHWDNVKMAALEMLSARGVSFSKKFAYENLEWNKREHFLEPSTQVSVVRALSHFDETEYLLIVKNWEKYGDWWVSEECCNIFKKLYYEGKLSKKVIGEIVELFKRQYLAKEHSRSEPIDSVADFLIELNSEELLPVLVGLLSQHHDVSKERSILKVLSSFKSKSAVRYLVQMVDDKSYNNSLKQTCAEALLNMGSIVQLEVFTSLIINPNKEISLLGIEGLKYYTYEAIKDTLKEHLNSRDPQKQSRALEVLVENGEIIQMIRQNSLPPSVGIPGIHVILSGIRKYKLNESEKVLDGISQWMENKQIFKKEYYLALDLAKTLNFIGKPEKGKSILSWFHDGSKFCFHEKYLNYWVLDASTSFDSSYSTKLALCFYSTHCLDDNDDSRYAISKFIEAAEIIKAPELKQELKQIVDSYIQSKEDRSYELERPLRALVILGDEDDEDWLLERIDFLLELDILNNFCLNRAIQCLTSFGTEKSIPTIKNIFKESLHKNVIDLCFKAYESILQRTGEFREIKDHELAG
ncbi:MAG: NACHT domain-containing protein [Imperialibacter sp.]|uniref:NACHT domain-containing protein n=1 Tax=Imperialibacter sp. TaxID=2038411 RepID=UPI003A856F80